MLLTNIAIKDRFIHIFFPSDKLKRKAERVEAKQKTSEEKNDRYRRSTNFYFFSTLFNTA